MSQRHTPIPWREWSFLLANCSRNAAQPSKCLKSRPALSLVFQKSVITVNCFTRQINLWMKYVLPPSQWKHSRTALLPSFLLLTGTTFVAPKRVKIRNIHSLWRLLFHGTTAIPGLLLDFRGFQLEGVLFWVMNYFSYIHSETLLGQACWLGRDSQRPQGPTWPQALGLWPHTLLCTGPCSSKKYVW